MSSSRTASMKMENLQEQLINVTAHRDEVQAQFEESQEQALQYMRSVENLQMVLEQFQRGIQTNTRKLYSFMLDIQLCSSWRSSKDHVLLLQCYYRRKPKLN